VRRESELDRQSQKVRLTNSRNDKGTAQVFNNLSHPLSFTLNQRAVGSTPTRPTKTITYLDRDTGSHFMGSAGWRYYGVNVIQNIDPMKLGFFLVAIHLYHSKIIIIDARDGTPA